MKRLVETSRGVLRASMAIGAAALCACSEASPAFVDAGSLGQAGVQAGAAATLAVAGANGAAGTQMSMFDAGVLDDATMSMDANGDSLNDDAGDDAGSSYEPCPTDGSPCKIMPYGDSITFGQGSSTLGGYRSELFRLAHAAGQSLTFVGTWANGPETVDGAAFPKNHEGYPGVTIGGLSGTATGLMTQHEPHIVTLMIGTNDLNLGPIDAKSVAAQLGDLMDAIVATDSKRLLIVAKITPTNDNARNLRTTELNAEIAAVAQARITAGKHVVLVDMQAAFIATPSYQADLLLDEVHPTDAGYAVLAKCWYAALAPVLH